MLFSGQDCRCQGGSATNEPLHRFKAEFFKALAHPARIMILEILREGETSVSELLGRLGLEPSTVSQQLGILRAKHLVEARKVGTSSFYHVVDPQLFTLLDLAREIFNNQLIDLQAIIQADVVSEPEPAER